MANRKPDHIVPPEGVLCRDAEATFRLGYELAGVLAANAVVSLDGPLGAGKTQFVSGLVQGLGSPAEVSSPTFALIHEYVGGPVTVFHFDFYRVEREEELLLAGYDDCVGAGVVIAEWGGKFPQLLPPDTLRLQFEILSQEERRIRLL